MKKLLVATLVAGLGIFGALAASQPFEGTLKDAGDMGAGVTVYQRYYQAGSSTIFAGFSSCPTAQQDTVNRACKMTFRSANGSYRGISDDIFNYDGADSTRYYELIEAQSGAGTGTHTGYYAWLSRVVVTGETGVATDINCAGSSALSCLGPAKTANVINAGGVTNTPQGTIANRGGLNAIPVPSVSGYNKGTGTISLTWATAAAVNDTSAARYQINYFLSDAAAGSCGAAPSETQFTALKDVTGTTTTVTLAELGLSAGAEKCATFAIRLRYPDAGGTAVRSLYLSANGQAVYLGSGGLASAVTNLQAKYIGGTSVSVSWNMTDEQGVDGFNVYRATTLNGNYEKVNAALVPANGTGAYTFIDTLSAPAGRVAAAGLFYKVETVGSTRQAMSSAVKATLGVSERPAIHKAAPKKGTR